MSNNRKEGPFFRAALKGYVREHLKACLVFVLMCFVFAVVVSLYDYPTETILYASALAGCIGFIALCIDFSAYYRTYGTLCRLSHSITLSLDGLPESSDPVRLQYQHLLRLLFEDKRHLQLEADRGLSDMMDYFMLWAHQIKTPIAAMGLLLQSEEPGRGDLTAELFKVEQYVEMALYYMRLESRDNDYVFKDYALDPIIRQALRKYSRLFIRKGLPLEFQETGVRVHTDEKWLGFVIEQLLSNAVKYTAQGQISISWEGDHLVISDSGIGIPESDLPRIFDKGYTGFNGRIEKKSTGLGLYLSKRILNALSHEIEVRSKPGDGTRVAISFPKELKTANLTDL